MTDKAPNGEPLGEYDSLVAQYRTTMSTGANPWGWHKVWDVRKPDPKTVTVKRRFRKPVTQEEWVTLQVTETMQNAYLLIRKRRKVITRLGLPTDSPLPGQIEAAFHRFCDLAEYVADRGVAPFDAPKLPEHMQAVELAAQVAALVDLALRRDAVVHHADPESLRRTAQALVTDLNTARAFLDTDPIDRQLNAPTETSTQPQRAT